MDIITVSCLGSMGRWGNSLFQYCTAKKYAQIYDCELQTPPWLGEHIFDLQDHRISTQLPRTNIDDIPWGQVNIDLYGHFQFQKIVSKWNRKELKEWLKFKHEWTERFPKKRPFYVACHIRSGDYITQPHVYCNITRQSYINKISSLGFGLKDVIFLDEQSPEVSNVPRGCEFLPDFMTLLNADVILRANSTFSWWAAVLSNAKVYSPLVESKIGVHDVEFVEGNWPRMVDITNLPGLNLKITDLHLAE